VKDLLETLIGEGAEDLFRPFSKEEYLERLLRRCTRNPDGMYS